MPTLGFSIFNPAFPSLAGGNKDLISSLIYSVSSKKKMNHTGILLYWFGRRVEWGFPSVPEGTDSKPVTPASPQPSGCVGIRGPLSVCLLRVQVYQSQTGWLTAAFLGTAGGEGPKYQVLVWGEDLRPSSQEGCVCECLCVQEEINDIILNKELKCLINKVYTRASGQYC